MSGKPELRKIALLNFGGIGDEILFSPVIREIRQAFPDAHLTLFLEDRSSAIRDLLPDVNEFVEVDVQGRSRVRLFWKISRLLRKKYFDAVISAGSSPFIPVMLWSSGVPIRVGFQTGPSSQVFLTREAPLNRTVYAADMYFTLATTFLSFMLNETYTPPSHVYPQLQAPPEADQAWAKTLIPAAPKDRKNLLIHPGVSQISIKKNILKGWPPQHWAGLIQHLAVTDQVYLVGGPDDADVIQDITRQLPNDLTHFTNLYGKTRNLRQLAALIQRGDALISVDSAPMHLAVGYKTPVISMFGPTDEKKLLPQAPQFHAVTQADLSCRPCLWEVRQTSCENPVCLDVSVAAMADAVHAVLTRQERV